MDKNMNKNIYTEEILLGHYEGDNNKEIIKYYLSNNLDEIIQIVNKQIINIFPNKQNIKWKINTDRLAMEIKEIMNKLNTNYSLAIFIDRKNTNVKHVCINYRAESEWLFCGGVIISNEYLTYEEIGAC